MSATAHHAQRILPKPLVLKLVLALVIVTSVSIVANMLLAPDGTLPPQLAPVKTVDYYNPGYSFQHTDQVAVVPEFSDDSELIPQGIPDHVVVLRKNTDEHGGGIIEVYAVSAIQGPVPLPYQFEFGEVETTPGTIAGVDATTYTKEIQTAGRMMSVRGIGFTAPYNGQDIVFDIRMTVFGTDQIDAGTQARYEEEYEKILMTFIVHNAPVQKGS